VRVNPWRSCHAAARPRSCRGGLSAVRADHRHDRPLGNRDPARGRHGHRPAAPPFAVTVRTPVWLALPNGVKIGLVPLLVTVKELGEGRKVPVESVAGPVHTVPAHPPCTELIAPDTTCNANRLARTERDHLRPHQRALDLPRPPGDGRPGKGTQEPGNGRAP